MSYILKNKLNRPIHQIGLLSKGSKTVESLTDYEKTLVEKGYLSATKVIKNETKKTDSKESKK